MPFDIAIRIEAAGRAGQDRAAVFSLPDGHLLALADGAGGTSGGAEAAEAVVESARTFNPASAVDCVRFLEQLDRNLTAIGQTTAILVALSENSLFGASVGDSRAWLVQSGQVLDLTADQSRKPLLGSGHARPVPFGPHSCVGRIVLGSDGLFNYVSLDRIRNLAAASSISTIPDELIAAARLPSGRLQDDISVIVAGQQAVAADGRASS